MVEFHFFFLENLVTLDIFSQNKKKKLAWSQVYNLGGDDQNET